MSYCCKCENSANRYTEFVPEEGDSHEMEKLNTNQYGTIDVEMTPNTNENAKGFSPANPFNKTKV